MGQAYGGSSFCGKVVLTLVEVVEDKEGKEKDADKALGGSCSHAIVLVIVLVIAIVSVFGTCLNNICSLGCLHPVQVSPGRWKG